MAVDRSHQAAIENQQETASIAGEFSA